MCNRVNYLSAYIITSANNQDLDQVQQNVNPDLDPNCSETVMVFLREFLKKEKSLLFKLPSMQRTKTQYQIVILIHKFESNW